MAAGGLVTLGLPHPQMTLSFVSSDHFLALSQCEGLEVSFDCHTPPFNIRAEMFDTGLGLFFCQAFASQMPSNIEDGHGVIQENSLGEIVLHQVDNTGQIP